jgi:hypothetical protein
MAGTEEWIIADHCRLLGFGKLCSGKKLMSAHFGCHRASYLPHGSMPEHEIPVPFGFRQGDLKRVKP